MEFMSVSLKGDAPYFPSSGINYDSNGIMVRPDEAIDCVNMNITASEIRPRPGTMHLNPIIPVTQPNEDILHYQDFLQPGGETVLFAFTDRDVYQYDKTTGWVSVADTGVIGSLRLDQWSTTPFVDLEYGATIVACGSRYTEPDVAEGFGNSRVLLFFNRSSGLFETLNVNINFPVTYEDTGEVGPSTVPPQTYYQGLHYVVDHADQFPEDPLNLGNTGLTLKYTDNPAGSLAPTVTVAMFSDIAKTVPTTVIEDCVAADIVITFKQQATSPTMQAVQDAVNEHAVAGQLVTVDGAVPLSYIVDAVAVTVPLGVTGVVEGGPLANNSTSSVDFVKIVPNSFTLITESGALCTSGTEVYNINGEDCYRLIPVDATYTVYGDESWVRLDGQGWQLTFVDDFYAGNSIFASYYYEKIGGYNPKVVQLFHNSLVFGNTFEDDIYYPWRLRYTYPGDMTLTNDDFFIDTVLYDISGIRAIESTGTETSSTIGTYLYVYKDQSILRGTYNPDTFVDFDTAFTEGLYANRTIQNVDGLQFFLGSNDIYMFDGNRRVSLTLDPEMKSTRIREYLMRILDPIILKNTFAVYDRTRRKYILYVKGRSELYPTLALVYDIDRRFWVRYVVPPTSAAIHVTMALSFSTIDSLEGTISQLIGTIDDLGGVTSNEVTIVAMTADSYVFLNDLQADKKQYEPNVEVPKEHYIVTRDFLFRSLEEAERVSMMKYEARGDATVDVLYSTEYEVLPSRFNRIPDHDVFPLTTGYKTHFYNCDTLTDKIRFCFRSLNNFKLRWVQAFSIPTTEITEE
jgi:hypothetical protein